MATIAHRSASSSATLAMTWGVLLVVAVVPLLVDLSNLDDTYYGLKARTLLGLAAVAALGLVGQHEIRSALLRDAGPVLAFGAAATAATVLSIDPRLALWGSSWRHEGLLVFLAYLVVCVASSELVRRRPLLWVGALLGSGGAMAVYGIAQYFGAELIIRDPLRADWVAAFATTGHPNYFGALMVLVLPFAVAACLVARNRTATAAAGFMSLVITLAALCSFSRAAWGGMLVAAGLMTVLVSRRLTGSPVGRGAVVLGLALAMTVVFGLPGGLLAPRDGSSFLAEVVTVTRIDSNRVADRLYLWTQTARLVIRRPVFGYGPDTFAAVLSQEWDERRRQLWGRTPRIIDKAHNDTLDMLMSFGVVGLLAYWGIIAAAFRSAARVIRSGGERVPWAIAGVCGLAGYLVALQFGFSVVSVAPVFWSVLGAMIGLSRPSRGAP